MIRRSRTIALAAVIALACGASIYLAPIIGRRWSPQRIYIVTIDTLRADHVGALGYPRNATPFIDSLSARGTLFERALSASSHTAPSHASMFTGLFPFQHGVRRNHETLDAEVPALPAYLKERGFTVAAFPAVEFLDGKVGFPASPVPLELSNRRSDWYLNAQEVFDNALAWLSGRAVSEKLLVWMHVYDVHQWKGRGKLPESYQPGMLAPRGAEMISFLEQRHNLPAEFHGGKERMLAAVDGYDLRLRFVDDQLKRLYESVTRAGMNGDALWIVTSDHGEGLGNHNYEGHGEYLYEEQLRVPLLIHSTGGEIPVTRAGGLVRSVDLFPSLAELVDGAAPGFARSIEGLSYARELLSGRWEGLAERWSFAERRPVDKESHRRTWRPGESFSLHSGRDKLIEYSEGADELYDLPKDPFELADIDDPDRENAVRGELMEILKRKHSERIKPDEPKLDDSQIEELRTLGYL